MKERHITQLVAGTLALCAMGFGAAFFALDQSESALLAVGAGVSLLGLVGAFLKSPREDR